jgi:hypothetical protein
MVENFVTFADIDEDQIGCYQVSDCVVVKDFGPYRKDAKLCGVCFDFLGGTIRVYADQASWETGEPTWSGRLSLQIDAD